MRTCNEETSPYALFPEMGNLLELLITLFQQGTLLDVVLFNELFNFLSSLLVDLRDCLELIVQGVKDFCDFGVDVNFAAFILAAFVFATFILAAFFFAAFILAAFILAAFILAAFILAALCFNFLWAHDVHRVKKKLFLKKKRLFRSFLFAFEKNSKFSKKLIYFIFSKLPVNFCNI